MDTRLRRFFLNLLSLSSPPAVLSSTPLPHAATPPPLPVLHSLRLQPLLPESGRRFGGLVNQSIEVVKKSIHRTAPIYRDRSASLIPWRTEESASGRDPDHGLSSGRLGGQARQDLRVPARSPSQHRFQGFREGDHGRMVEYRLAENSSDDHGSAAAKVPYTFKAKRSWPLLRRHLHATSDVSRGEAGSRASIMAAHHASAGRRSSIGRPCEDLQGET